MAATTDRAAFVKYDRTLGSASDEDRGFYYPVDACLSPDGRIYGLSRSHEASTKSIRVCVLDLDSEFYGVFGSIGEGDGQFTWPTSLARDSEGRVYVGDEYLDRISAFDDVGNYLGKWGVHGSEPGMLDGPCGLAFDANDDLYVSDHRNHRIQKFTSDGRYIAHFGREGSGSGRFNLPWGLTVAPGGDVYVADWRNDRVQRFTPDGELVSFYGCSGGGDGQLIGCAGTVAVGPAGQRDSGPLHPQRPGVGLPVGWVMQYRQGVVEQVLHTQPQPFEVALRRRRQVGATLLFAAVQHRLLAIRLFGSEPCWETSGSPIYEV